LVAILVGAGFAGLGVPWILEIVLVLLSAASAITVVQRIVMVHGQTLATEPIAPAPADTATTDTAPDSPEPPPPPAATRPA
jgi:CDP-diacylglycerol--glycerol-3-phosphate 3-phosphatidyltransferase